MNWLTNEKSYSTPLTQVLNSAKGLENYRYEHILVIFSDMLQESRDKTLDLKNIANFNSEQINLKVEQINQTGKIPNLDNCKVFAFGATTTPNSGVLANRQFENTQLFWQKFFALTDADLCAYAFDCRKEINDIKF